MRTVDPSFYVSEFRNGLVFSSGVETAGDVFDFVFVDEKKASQWDHFRIECQNDGLDVQVAGVIFWRSD